MSKQEARTDKAHGASPAPLGKDTKPVRISFDMTEDEAARLCALRYEPKPSTAAAQVVRMALGGGAAAQGARLAPRAQDKARARDGEGAAGKARKKLSEWCGANLAGAIARRYPTIGVPTARAFQTLFDLGTSWRVFGSLTDAKDAALACLLDPSESDAACVEWPEMAAPEIAAKLVKAEIGGTYAARLLAIFPEAEAALAEEERRLIVTDERLAELRVPAKVAWYTDSTDAKAKDAAQTGE